MAKFGHWTNQRRASGRFRRAMMEDFGISRDDIADGPLICSKCGQKWNPVIKQDPCFDCQEKPAPPAKRGE